MGLTVEQAARPGSGEFGVKVPEDADVSPALGLAARHLAGRDTGFEFLPPKVSAWKQITDRYSSRKLVWSGAAAGVVALVIALAFGVQQWQLTRLRSKWVVMEPQVKELKTVQQKITRYRPWFDESFGSLSILRRVTEAFPADGSVFAKSLEIRDDSTATCAGVTLDPQAILKTLDRLRATDGVNSVNIVSLNGERPKQFVFSSQWGAGRSHED
jgi:hypothetical protein